MEKISQLKTTNNRQNQNYNFKKNLKTGDMQVDGARGECGRAAGEAEAAGPEPQAEGVGGEVGLRAHGRAQR